MDRQYSLIAFVEGGQLIERTEKLAILEDDHYVPLLQIQPNVQVNSMCFASLNGKWKLCTIRQFAGKILCVFVTIS